MSCCGVQSAVRSAGRESGAWSSCVIRWRRTRALPFPVGDPPIGWAWAHVTDMWLYWRSPPGCHWRRNGGAAELGNGVGAGATMARLAAGGEGGDFPLHCLKPMVFPWHRVWCHMPSEEAGASPSPPHHCSTGDGFPVLLIQGFWQKRKKGGRGRSVKGSLVRKLFLKLEGGFVFIMHVDRVEWNNSI